MTTFQIVFVFIISWWMLLFMVLPFRAHAPQAPQQGHAPSAPANPLLKKKFIWTTGLALFVTGLIYVASGFIHIAQAAEDIYHASSAPKSAVRCKNRPYVAPAAIHATEGQGRSGKQVAPATLGGAAKPDIAVDLNINGDAYVKQPVPPTPTPASPNSYLGLGKVAVGADGSVNMNGKPLAPAQEHCDE